MLKVDVRTRLLAGCLVLSGAAGLVYEVCWIRAAGLIFGVTTFAVSAVLAVFFLGLAIGSQVFGRAGQSTQYPLRWYCLLEFLLAVFGLASLWTFELADAAYGWFYRMQSSGSFWPLIGSLAVIGMALLPPTILMGGTLPLYCRHFVVHERRITGTIGLLYALNTLGAAAGCAIAGLWLIPAFGVSSSVRIAAGLSLTAALITALAAWNWAAHDSSPPSTVPPQRIKLKYSATVTALFFGSGFVALGGEILWVRYLALFVHNTLYTYSLTLTIVLAGLVIGSLMVTAAAQRVTAPLFFFGLMQVLIGVWVSGVMLLPVSLWRNMGHSSLWIYLGLLLVPSIFSGAALPLVILRSPQRSPVCQRPRRVHGGDKHIRWYRGLTVDRIWLFALARPAEEPLVHDGTERRHRCRGMVGCNRRFPQAWHRMGHGGRGDVVRSPHHKSNAIAGRIPG